MITTALGITSAHGRHTQASTTLRRWTCARAAAQSKGQHSRWPASLGLKAATALRSAAVLPTDHACPVSGVGGPIGPGQVRPRSHRLERERLHRCQICAPPQTHSHGRPRRMHHRIQCGGPKQRQGRAASRLCASHAVAVLRRSGPSLRLASRTPRTSHAPPGHQRTDVSVLDDAAASARLSLRSEAVVRIRGQFRLAAEQSRAHMQPTDAARMAGPSRTTGIAPAKEGARSARPGVQRRPARLLLIPGRQSHASGATRTPPACRHWQRVPPPPPVS